MRPCIEHKLNLNINSNLHLFQAQSVVAVAFPRSICYGVVWLRSQSGQQSAATAHRLSSASHWQGWRQQRLVAGKNRWYGIDIWHYNLRVYVIKIWIFLSLSLWQVGYFPKEYVQEHPVTSDELWYYNYEVYFAPKASTPKAAISDTPVAVQATNEDNNNNNCS